MAAAVLLFGRLEASPRENTLGYLEDVSHAIVQVMAEQLAAHFVCCVVALSTDTQPALSAAEYY